MKKMISVLLALLLCLSVLAGCTHNDGEKAQFDFSYSVEKTKYARGETIQITATVTNVSGRTYRYVGCSGNDFIPFISLYNEIDGEKYYIECDPIVLPEDVVNKKVKNGESGSIVNTFTIPEDAMLGNYTLTLSLGEDKHEFADILSIVELTKQNENTFCIIISKKTGGHFVRRFLRLIFRQAYDTYQRIYLGSHCFTLFSFCPRF